MLSRQGSSLVRPLHGSSNRAEMAVVSIKGFAAVMCEIRGVLADEPPHFFLFPFLRSILKQQLTHICHSAFECEGQHLSHDCIKLASHRFTTHEQLMRLGIHSAKV